MSIEKPQTRHEQKKLLCLRAFRLRVKGYTYLEIGDELGVTDSTAMHYVQQVLKLIEQTSKAEATSYRDVEAARLDGMLKALWPKIEAGNIAAVDVGIKLVDRRAKLLGLDQPTKIAPTNPDGTMEYGTGNILGPDEQARRIAEVFGTIAIGRAVLVNSGAED